MAIQIKKAVRERVWLKIGITGAAGSGKTFGGIGLAMGLVGDGKILVLDTENRSASYYAGDANTPGAWSFDVVEIEAPFTPNKYLEGLRAAIENGYQAVVIDSLSHEWAASGGILDQKSMKDARGDNRGNGFANWQDMKRIHNKFMEELLQSHIHVIATLRSKMEYVQEEVNGKKEVRKLGLSPIAQDETEYEFGLVFDVERNSHLATASKDRTGLFEGRTEHLREAIGKELRAWRDSGAELKPEPPTTITTSAAATAPQGSAPPPATVETRATSPRAQSAAQPVAQGAKAPTPSPEPPAEWVSAMTELAAATLGMPEQTRAKLVATWEAEGPEKLKELKAEIATIRQAMEPTTVGAVMAQLPQREKAPSGQAASTFVDGVDPDTDETNGGINRDQYDALDQLIGAFGINRDALRSYCFKAGHLLPGANGPTLARMKADYFVQLRDKLCNKKIASGKETWSERTVRIINATPITTFQPIPAAS